MSDTFTPDFANMSGAAKQFRAGNRVPEGDFLCKLVDGGSAVAQTGREFYFLDWRILSPKDSPARGRSCKMRFFPSVQFSYNSMCAALDSLGVDLTQIAHKGDVLDAIDNLVMEGPNRHIRVKINKKDPQYNDYSLVEAKAITKVAVAQDAAEEPDFGEEPVEDQREPEVVRPPAKRRPTPTPTPTPAPTRAKPSVVDPFADDEEFED